MEYKIFGDTIVLRINVGESIIETIENICKKESIALATVSGIGACNLIEAGLFDTDKKKYLKSSLEGAFEITSITGNITTMNNEVYIHLHATWSDSECKCYGGHLNKAIVSATSEIIIHKIHGSVDRKFSEEVGLNLIDFR